MIQTLYFVLMVVCVGWLMIWSALPEFSRNTLWWPFAMRDDDPEAPAATDVGATEATPGQGALSWRDRAARALAQRRPDAVRAGRHATTPGRRAS